MQTACFLALSRVVMQCHSVVVWQGMHWQTASVGVQAIVRSAFSGHSLSEAGGQVALLTTIKLFYVLASNPFTLLRICTISQGSL
jgi:hypothetical protein